MTDELTFKVSTYAAKVIFLRKPVSQESGAQHSFIMLLQEI